MRTRPLKLVSVNLNQISCTIKVIYSCFTMLNLRKLFGIYVCSCIFMFVCECMFSRGMVHMKSHGGQRSTSGLDLQDSHLQSLSMIRGSPNKLRWLASKSMGSTCLSLLGVRINVCTAECRFFYWILRRDFSCLRHKHFNGLTNAS